MDVRELLDQKKLSYLRHRELLHEDEVTIIVLAREVGEDVSDFFVEAVSNGAAALKPHTKTAAGEFRGMQLKEAVVGVLRHYNKHSPRTTGQISEELKFGGIDVPSKSISSMCRQNPEVFRNVGVTKRAEWTLEEWYPAGTAAPRRQRSTDPKPRPWEGDNARGSSPAPNPEPESGDPSLDV